MPTHRPRTASPTPTFAPKGVGSLSAWARVTQPIAALQDAASQSHQMWLCVRPLLPQALLEGVRAGRWHDGVWSLTASSSAVAAKLSQFKPTLLHQLRAQGHDVRDIRIRVQPQGAQAAPMAAAATLEPLCPPAVKARLQALLRRGD
ncbi:DciA family protein [Thiomonas intermedia]|uniref:DciA family protein n=1 Tax=Thiomonas intermedia TaxID=926 RepID=UPI001FE4C70D|nr:DciA family protein [Thiomonas intermedia]